jgi:hypothetical protein
MPGKGTGTRTQKIIELHVWYRCCAGIIQYNTGGFYQKPTPTATTVAVIILLVTVQVQHGTAQRFSRGAPGSGYDNPYCNP